MKTIHVDGGAHIEPPSYKFHDAYFSVIDDDNNLIHKDLNLGDIYAGEAEFRAIKWAVENIKERPLKVTSDCQTALAWAKKSTKNSLKRGLRPLDLTGVTLEYQHNNLADQYNARNISPKYDRAYYYQRWLASGSPSKKYKKHRFKP